MGLKYRNCSKFAAVILTLIVYLCICTNVFAADSTQSRNESGKYAQAIMNEEGTTNILSANQSSAETDLSGWTTNGVDGASISRVTGGWDGNYSVQCNLNPGDSWIGFEGLPYTPGSTYTFSIYAKGTPGRQIDLVYDDGMIEPHSKPFILSDNWQRFTYTFTLKDPMAPPFTYPDPLYVFIRDPNAESQIFYMDGCQLEQKPYATSPYTINAADDPSHGKWTYTNIWVEAEQSITINASGRGAYGPNSWFTTDPDGNHYDGDILFPDKIYDPLAVLSSAPIGTLIGALMDAEGNLSQLIPLGSNVDVIAPTSGYLILTYNDTPNGYYDNSGQYFVNVKIAEDDNINLTNISAGVYPWAIAVNPVTNKIYVTNYYSNNVTVIDGVNNYTGTVASGVGPYNIAINSVTNKIYVKNWESDYITVIDGSNNSTENVSTGIIPRDMLSYPEYPDGTVDGIAVNPFTNKIYVLNELNNSVTVLNGTDNTVTLLEVGTEPSALAVNPVTNKIYVTNYGSNNVTIIDGENTTTATVAVGVEPVTVSVNPVTNKIYVGYWSSGNVTVIDGENNTTETVTTATYTWKIAVNPVTNKIYVVNGTANETTNNYVTVIDGANNTTETVDVGLCPQLIAVNSVTNKIYVTNWCGNNVTVIDGTNNTTNTYDAGTWPWGVAVNSNTNKTYVTNPGSNEITVLDMAGNIDTPNVTNVQPSPTSGYAGDNFTITANVTNNPDIVFVQFKNPGGGWISEDECKGKFTLNQTGTNPDGSSIYSISMPVIMPGIEAEQYQRYFRVIAIDTAGNRNSDYTKKYSFVVRPNALINYGIPYLVSTSPTDGTRAFWINHPITATFSNPMNTNAINQNNIVLKCESQVVPIQLSYVENTFEVLITPETPLQPLKSYALSFSQDIMDIQEERLLKPYTVNFLTSATEDAASIQIVNPGMELSPGQNYSLAVQYNNLQADSSYNIKVLGSCVGEENMQELTSSTVLIISTLSGVANIPIVVPTNIPNDQNDARLVLRVIFEKNEETELQSMSNDSLHLAQSTQANKISDVKCVIVNYNTIGGYVSAKINGQSIKLKGIRVDLFQKNYLSIEQMITTYTDENGYYGFRTWVEVNKPARIVASMCYSTDGKKELFSIRKDSEYDNKQTDANNWISYVMQHNDSDDNPVSIEVQIPYVQETNQTQDFVFDAEGTSDNNACTVNNSGRVMNALINAADYCLRKRLKLGDNYKVELNDDDYPTSFHNGDRIVINHRHSYYPSVSMHELGHSVDEHMGWNLPYGQSNTRAGEIGENWANLVPSLVNNDFRAYLPDGNSMLEVNENDYVNHDNTKLAGVMWKLVRLANGNSQFLINALAQKYPKWTKDDWNKQAKELFERYCNQFDNSADPLTNYNKIQGVFINAGFYVGTDTDNWVTEYEEGRTPLKTLRKLNTSETIIQIKEVIPTDSDNNGLINELIVKLSIPRLNNDGCFLRAFLVDNSDSQAAVMSKIEILPSEQSQDIELTFYGDQIYANHLKGGYKLNSVSIYDEDYNEYATTDGLDVNIDTSLMDYAQYEHGGAYFQVTPSTTLEKSDTSSDQYDTLKVIAQVYAQTGGEYEISGNLVRDVDGEQLTASKTINLNQGLNEVILSWPIANYSPCNNDSSFTVKLLGLFTVTGMKLEEYLELPATEVYTAEALQGTVISLSSSPYCNTLDDDLDTLFDSLTVELPVNVSQDCNVYASACLKNENGIAIATAYSPISHLETGTGKLTFTFKGSDINSSRKDGPYNCEFNLHVDGDRLNITESQRIFTSGVYQYEEFEPDQTYDFTVDTTAVTLFADEVKADKGAQLYVIVTNNGEGRAFNTGVRLVQNGVTVAEKGIESIEAKGFSAVLFPLIIRSLEDTLTVEVDWDDKFVESDETNNSAAFTVLDLMLEMNPSASPIVQIGINSDDGNSAGIFVGLKDISDAQGNPVPDAKLLSYQIEIDYDHNRAVVLNAVDEAHLGGFTFDNGANTIITSAADEVDQGTNNIEELFFVPLGLTGTSTIPTDVTIKFTNLTDSNSKKINIPDVTLTFQRGKIVNEVSQSLSIGDAVAGLQYLAEIRDVGLDPGQVNVINMASILQPEAGATCIKPSVKDVIALMQQLIGLRDESFQLVLQ